MTAVPSERQLIVSRMAPAEVLKLDRLVVERTTEIGLPISRSKLLVELVEAAYDRMQQNGTRGRRRPR